MNSIEELIAIINSYCQSSSFSSDPKKFGYVIRNKYTVEKMNELGRIHSYKVMGEINLPDIDLKLLNNNINKLFENNTHYLDRYKIFFEMESLEKGIANPILDKRLYLYIVLFNN